MPFRRVRPPSCTRNYVNKAVSENWRAVRHASETLMEDDEVACAVFMASGGQRQVPFQRAPL